MSSISSGDRGVLYQRYRYGLSHAYRRLGVPAQDLISTFDEAELLQCNDVERLVALASKQIKRRLSGLSMNLGGQVLDRTKVRMFHCRGRPLFIPIINAQGQEWYGSSSVFNFDFIAEEALGLLDNASVIYDFGAHHGVWSAFYSRVVGNEGRVYSYEPSILNFEISSLLYLLNGCTNVMSFNSAIGPRTGGADGTSGLLVDFVDAAFDVHGLHFALVDRPDFLKIDIEGFEYDLLLENGWLFELDTNIHLELHIPHLERRGLDYRRITELIDVRSYQIWNHKGFDQSPLETLDSLAGYCSLMMKKTDLRNLGQG